MAQLTKRETGPLPRQPSRETVVERSAGGVLLSGGTALIVRFRSHVYELPKGHLELGETAAQAAIRELYEETALLSKVYVTTNLGTVRYSFESRGRTVDKEVRYFAFRTEGGSDPEFGPRPDRTRELRWIAASELAELPLINQELREIIDAAFKEG